MLILGSLSFWLGLLATVLIVGYGYAEQKRREERAARTADLMMQAARARTLAKEKAQYIGKHKLSDSTLEEDLAGYIGEEES